MKKSVFALVMALVLLCGSALATGTGFTFTAEDYVAGYTQFCNDALQKEVVWSDPVDTDDGLTGVAGTAEGMNDVYVYTAQGDTACAGMGTELTVGLSDSELTAKSQAFGTTVAAIPFASRYVELDNDIVALSGDLQAIQDACMTLVQNVFSSDAINTAIADGSYSETAEVAGHTAQLKLVVDMDSMAMTVTFVFVP